MKALLNIDATQAESVTAIFEGIQNILEASCDEATKQVALTTVGRMVLQSISVTNSQFFGGEKKAEGEEE